MGAARPSASFAYLDHALWKEFQGAASAADRARAWLALQCRFIDGADSGVIVAGEPDVGPFAPLAFWPEEQGNDPELAAAAESCLAERSGIVRGNADESDATGFCYVAHPLIVDRGLCGVIAVRVKESPSEMRHVLRQLQWGSGWLEALWRQEQHADDDALRERTSVAFDMVASVLEQERFNDACNALVTELAVRLECDEVSVGFIHRQHAKVIGLSHAAKFGKRMNLVRDIGAAMDEAIDQRAVILYPAQEDWDYRVIKEHEELAAGHRLGSVLTIPLHVREKMVGALTFERGPDRTFDEETVEMCDAVASVVGPILEDKRRNDRHILRKIAESITTQLRRLVGPEYFGRKLALGIVVLVVLFFAFAKGEFRVTSPAVLEGLVQRSVVAPFEGYLASQRVRAGETVGEGDLMATLDDRDLSLERSRWFTTLRQRQAEYDRALAERDRAEANIIRAQIDQASAQLELLDKQLARTRIMAPFDGIVVAGDLSQSVGATVERGQELFKITPLNAYRVILEVDESDIESISIGQRGALRIASMPETPMAYTVERITPISEQGEGRNFYRVEAMLDEPSEAIRPGMKGIAKTEIEERLLIRIWTEKLTDWLRLKFWKWMP